MAVIRQGRLLAEGTPEQLRTCKGGRRVEIIGDGFSESLLTTLRRRPEIQSVEQDDGRLLLELQPGTKVAQLLPVLLEAGAEIEEIRKGQVNLEDVFLTLVEDAGAD